jgi:hypothetical protein
MRLILKTERRIYSKAAKTPQIYGPTVGFVKIATEPTIQDGSVRAIPSLVPFCFYCECRSFNTVI